MPPWPAMARTNNDLAAADLKLGRIPLRYAGTVLPDGEGTVIPVRAAVSNTLTSPIWLVLHSRSPLQDIAWLYLERIRTANKADCTWVGSGRQSAARALRL